MPGIDEVFQSVAEQLMSGKQVEVEGRRFPVRRCSSQRLRMATFIVAGHEYTAIEQNPEKPSRWGKLAREGHRVVQLKDVEQGKFIGVSVDGQVKRYGHSE
jgi:hypothetical protein